MEQLIIKDIIFTFIIIYGSIKKYKFNCFNHAIYDTYSKHLLINTFLDVPFYILVGFRYMFFAYFFHYLD